MKIDGETMFDVIALGELLIDFAQKPNENMTFLANAGGAPCNVLAALSKLGKSTAFIGKVGDDMFGRYLENTLKQIDINTDGLIISKDEFTTLAFVALDSEGNRSFSFARNNSADVMLRMDEVNFNLIAQSKVFHCGTLSLTHPNSRMATIKALEYAKESDLCVSVDPNLRMNLWKSEKDAKEAIKLVLRYANIVKISDYEIDFLYGNCDINTAIQKIAEEFNPKVIFITCGKDGAYMAANGNLCFEPCIEGIKTIDTTGAGDCFCGAALSQLLDVDLKFEELTVDKCEKILKFANASANLSTTKYGAIPSMPTVDEILEIL